MPSKKFNTFLASLIFIIISLFFWGNYLEHQSELAENTKINTQTQKEAEAFTLQKVQDLKQVELYYTPYMELNEIIVKKIRSAKKRVYLEVYMFTETRIFEAMKQAQTNGIQVRVVLEKYPYMAANVNNKIFEALKSAGIDVVWSDSSDYKLNHAKFLIIDDEAFISTGNMTYSTFKHNRDFFIQTSDENILQTLLQIFADDYAGEKVTQYHDNLIVSPSYSRTKIQKMLSQAETSIKIYMQYFLDDEINTLLKKLKQEKNIDIQILVDSKNRDSQEVRDLEKSGIDIGTITTKIHAKAILIDETYLFIGSENFSKSSLDYNREIGIIIKNPYSIQRFLQVFIKDKKEANILQNEKNIVQ